MFILVSDDRDYDVGELSPIAVFRVRETANQALKEINKKLDELVGPVNKYGMRDSFQPTDSTYKDFRESLSSILLKYGVNGFDPQNHTFRLHDIQFFVHDVPYSPMEYKIV